MKVNLSNSAIITAIIAIHNDINNQREYMKSADITDDEYANEGEALLEMEKAFGEFYSIYIEALKVEPTLPNIEELIGGKP